jgi:hypothetical protein
MISTPRRFAIIAAIALATLLFVFWIPRSTRDITASIETPKLEGRIYTPVSNKIVQPEVLVHAGGSEWKLLLTDRSLTDSDRQLIAADLDLIHKASNELQIRTFKTPLTYQDSNSTFTFQQWVKFLNVGRPRPAALLDTYFGCLFNDQGTNKLFIPPSVINEYKSALARKQLYNTEYHQLSAFIETLETQKSQPHDSLESYFWNIPHDDTDAGTSQDAELLRNFLALTHAQPSILEINSTQGGRYAEKGSLVAIVYTTGDGKSFQAIFPLIYNGGKWRFLFIRY